MHNEPDQLLAQAAHRHATRFPNPERRGCPPPGQLTSQIWRGQLPAPSLRQHLLACSECFIEYRAQLAAYQAAQPAAPTWWHQWLPAWRVKATLAVAFVVVVSLGGWFVWQQARAPLPTQMAAQTAPAAPLPVPSITPSPPATASVRPMIPASPVPTPRAALPPTQAIDLNDYITLRNVTGTEGTPIRLLAEHVRLQLTLPEGSAKGTYTVRLVDAFGRTLRRATAFSSTGQTLTVTLDLQSQAAQHYRLQISRGAEAPDYYPVTITEKHR